MAKYFKRLESKFLVSGPAPLGRILNYIKRIKLGQYRTSTRGPTSPDNLDNWTICFMVGLGLIKKPKHIPSLKIKLTDNGEKIYQLIKTIPNFIDREAKSKVDMREIKNQMKNYYLKLYQILKETFLNSDSLKNLAIFFQKNNINKIKQKKFYKEFGKVFRIYEAGFNRLPSLIQIAEFCDILVENGENIKIFDPFYIKDFSILSNKDIVKEEMKKEKKILDQEEIELLKDISETISPEERKTIVNLYKRNSGIAKKLKKLYNDKCQICGFTFKKENGENYSEANHLIPLGENGSDSISNLTILCANCHSQLTYAKIKLGKLKDNKRFIKINDVQKKIKYHPMHFKAVKESDIKV